MSLERSVENVTVLRNDHLPIHWNLVRVIRSRHRNHRIAHVIGGGNLAPYHSRRPKKRAPIGLDRFEPSSERNEMLGRKRDHARLRGVHRDLRAEPRVARDGPTSE